MLRRLFALVLVSALLAPVPSFSASTCRMMGQDSAKGGMSEQCDCCHGSSSKPALPCANGTPVALRCACSLQSHSEPRSATAPVLQNADLRPTLTPALLPAAATLPRFSHAHAVDLSTLHAKSASPPLRPLLCSWLI